MKSNRRLSLGRIGESIAANYLMENGYSILEKNWRTPYGEIDLVARRDQAVVFVEVKTRASESLGPPEISITPRKAEHMRSSAEYFIQQHPELNLDWRIDLISVQIKPAGKSKVEHFENVLT